MRKFRKTIEVKLNLGEITDLLITYEPKARDAMRNSVSPEDCNKAMAGLIRKLNKAKNKLQRTYKSKKRE